MEENDSTSQQGENGHREVLPARSLNSGMDASLGEAAKASPPPREEPSESQRQPCGCSGAGVSRSLSISRGHALRPRPRPPGLPRAAPRRRCGCCAVRSRAEEPWSQSRECALPTFYSLSLESKTAYPLRFRLEAAATGHACALPLHKPRSFWIFP